MIALNNIDDKHIREIAGAFADSFLAEEGVVSWSLDYDDAVQYFYHTLKEFVRCGRLFATSDMEEGFIVWYRKGHGLPWYRELLLTVKYMSLSSMCSLTAGAALLFILGCDAAAAVIYSVCVVFMIYRHKENIKRLVKGTESKFSLGNKK